MMQLCRIPINNNGNINKYRILNINYWNCQNLLNLRSPRKNTILDSESYINNQQKLPNLSLSINTNIKTCNSYRIQARQSFQDIIKCKICFTYIEYDNFQLHCKHSFHKDCLKDQLYQQINQGQSHINVLVATKNTKLLVEKSIKQEYD
ncbi:unnamed protein product (macronuclear) [Paramecium tetraurelia]|uniref:Zinc finger C3HC4 RING-type domain-containing protein n=1 Tax=Paramecium tetraurelia TaxID=5888 RepID=A0CZT0_PARTE|nr:uncharacterized protein GSPATT00011870001 [Paramecium tetraurelia]CAK76297.1 unnamed protein product [Paramecium tetraurelia]|eukprot:XP_001443694.1 hypothetical protein (macronuclear) [Paramecium tetraurelia strain d4-2]